MLWLTSAARVFEAVQIEIAKVDLAAIAIKSRTRCCRTKPKTAMVSRRSEHSRGHFSGGLTGIERAAAGKVY
jgi:hypothetical protein